jgi:hypothetical protein
MMNGFEKNDKKKLGVIANRATTTTSHINYKNKNKNIYNINSSHRNERRYNNALHSDGWKNSLPHTRWDNKSYSIGWDNSNPGQSSNNWNHSYLSEKN